MIDRVGWALVQTSWQATLFAAACAALLYVLRGARSETRYRVLMLGLLLLPLLAVAADLANVFDWRLASASVGGVGSAVPPGDARGLALLGEWLVLVRWRVDAVLPWFVYAWLTGVALLSLRCVAGWLAVRRLIRGSTIAPAALSAQFSAGAASLGIDNRVLLLLSDEFQVPAALGWRRPCVVLPRLMLRALPDERIDAILTHELSHIARGDYAANLLQIALETLVFFHPAVWWLSARIRAERENCCDDIAASCCGDVGVYVRALAELEQLRAAAIRLPALAANGGSLVERVRRLVQPQARVSRARRAAASLCACTVFALLLVGTRAAAYAPALAAERLTMFLHAEDPAGEFTITLKGARVIAASVDRTPVPATRLRQTGNHLEFLDDAGASTLSVSLVPGKGIHWTPRHAAVDRLPGSGQNN
jgi:beta-lactamase regulating signal transducer with metallopeptidase domain